MTNNPNLNPKSVQLDQIVDPDHYRAIMVEGFLPPCDKPASPTITDGDESWVIHQKP